MIPVSPVTPNEATHEIMLAEDQQEYQSMPIVLLNDGKIQLSRWELTDEDIEELKIHKSIWVYHFTFGHPAQPLRLETEIPVLRYEIPEDEWDETVTENEGEEP